MDVVYEIRIDNGWIRLVEKGTNEILISINIDIVGLDAFVDILSKFLLRNVR